MSETFDVKLTAEEIALLVEALDSHIYWQLSEEEYRDSGYVREPGSDDPEKIAAIEAAKELSDQLQQLQPTLAASSGGGDCDGTEDLRDCRASKPWEFES